MLYRTFTTLLLLVVAISFATSQQTADTLLVAPGSSLELKGTSTLHNFECTTTILTGTVTENAESKVFVNGSVTIPVRDIHSGKSSMDDNMYEALKAEKNPNILFTLKESKMNAASTLLVGDLSIAGETRSVDIDVVVTDSTTGILKVVGSKDLLMTDFGVDPPSFMLGALRTGDKVTIEFNLLLKRNTGHLAVTSTK